MLEAAKKDEMQGLLGQLKTAAGLGGSPAPKTPKPPQAKKWVSAGGYVIPSMENADKVYIVKPANNYGPWTLPKGKVDAGESLREAAVREVFEETGITAKVITSGGSNGYLGRGVGSYSMTHFFLMVRTGGTPTKNEESEEVKLVTWDRAKSYFKNSGNKRDGAIVDMAIQSLRAAGVIKTPEKPLKQPSALDKWLDEPQEVGSKGTSKK